MSHNLNTFLKTTIPFVFFDWLGLHQGRPANAILNCLLAHQLCAEDPSCKSIETVIQHICGPETGKYTRFIYITRIAFKELPFSVPFRVKLNACFLYAAKETKDEIKCKNLPYYYEACLWRNSLLFFSRTLAIWMQYLSLSATSRSANNWFLCLFFRLLHTHTQLEE